MPHGHHNVLVSTFPEHLESEDKEGRYRAALLALTHVLLNVREAIVGDLSDMMHWKLTSQEQTQEAYADAITMLTVLEPDLKESLQVAGEHDVSIHRTPDVALRMVRLILDIPFHEELRERWGDLASRLESKDSATRHNAHAEIGHLWADWIERRQKETEELKDKTSAWDASEKRGKA